MVIDGFQDPEYLEAVKGTNLGDYLFQRSGFSLDVNKAKMQEVDNEYYNLFGEHAFSEVVGHYTAFTVLYEALERAGSLEPEKIKNAILATEMSDAEVPIMGSVKFNANGQNINTKMLMLQFKEGQWRTVFPWEYANVSIMFPIPSWSQRP